MEASLSLEAVVNAVQHTMDRGLSFTAFNYFAVLFVATAYSLWKWPLWNHTREQSGLAAGALLGALLSAVLTWRFMLKYLFESSPDVFVHDDLFVQAYQMVVSTPCGWLWSEQLLSWSIPGFIFLFVHGSRSGVEPVHLLAYSALAMFGAVSVCIALFLSDTAARRHISASSSSSCLMAPFSRPPSLAAASTSLSPPTSASTFSTPTRRSPPVASSSFPFIGSALRAPPCGGVVTRVAVGAAAVGAAACVFAMPAASVHALKAFPHVLWCCHAFLLLPLFAGLLPHCIVPAPDLSHRSFLTSKQFELCTWVFCAGVCLLIHFSAVASWLIAAPPPAASSIYALWDCGWASACQSSITADALMTAIFSYLFICSELGATCAGLALLGTPVVGLGCVFSTFLALRCWHERPSSSSSLSFQE